MNSLIAYTRLIHVSVECTDAYAIYRDLLYVFQADATLDFCHLLQLSKDSDIQPIEKRPLASGLAT